jgi:hypothetical protein
MEDIILLLEKHTGKEFEFFPYNLHNVFFAWSTFPNTFS